MTHKNKKTYQVISFSIFILFLLSCRNPLSNLMIDLEEDGSKEGGSLAINILSVTAKGLIPDLDMTPASYALLGNGPNGSNFNESTAASSVVIPDLDFGDWTITVDALNADSIIIGRGQDSVAVHAGQITTLNIAVTPLDGYGTLDLTLLWTPEDTENPSIEARMIPAAGSTIDLSFTITSPGTATYTSSTIPTGYYTLVLKLLDNNILVLGAVEMVRIIKDQTTSGQFEFYEINDPGGQISINITPELNDPIEVTMSGQVEEIYFGELMTVTAAVPPEVGNVVYAWYINGESKTTGLSYTLGSDLAVGIYRLDVTAFTADGSRAGSATYIFRVLEGLLTRATLIWDPNTEPDLAGYKLHYGFSSRNYEFVVDVGNQTTYTLTNLESDKTYYIAATAYNTVGLESNHSGEVIFNHS